MRRSAVADWYVRNVADNEWWVNEKFGAETMLVPQGSQVGARVLVLEPGKPSTLYHRETGQQGMLVVEGECLLIAEGEERTLRAMDEAYAPFPRWESSRPAVWDSLPWSRAR